MPRRVYTGGQAACFADRRIGRLEPGEEFDAPADSLEGLDRRADITVPAAGAEAQESRRRPAGKRPGGTPAADEQEAPSCQPRP